MKFTSLPEAYSSFREPLLYAFDTQSSREQEVEIKITNKTTGELLGTKRLYGVTKGEVDIAPYLRSAAKVSLPERITTCGEVDTGAQIRVQVSVNGTTSSTRNFIAAKVDLDAYYLPLTTQHQHRTMAHDEFDLISFYSYPDIVVEVVVEFFGKGTDRITIAPGSGGQRVVAVTALGREWADQMRVTIMVDGEAETVYDYDIKSNLRGARRIAWLNDWLAPELYTFPLRKSVLIEAARKRMESIWGREAGAAERENELKLISAYEPQMQIEALSSILSTPKAWLVKGCELQRVEITTERVMPAKCGQMGIIEVDIRAAEEGVKLW